MVYALSSRSLQRLEGVHPDLVAIVKRAITISKVDFMVIEGMRSEAQQQENIRKGVSWTMRSRHLVHADGYAYAVDLAPLIGGKIPWDNWRYFEIVADAMKQAARDLGVPIEWGGDWKKTRDGPHFQLPWGKYPGNLSKGEIRRAVADEPRNETHLGQSRTIQGAGAGATAGTVITVDNATDMAQQLDQAQGHISTGTLIGLAAGAVIIGASLYVIYARWDDAGRPGIREWLRS